jgi:hypothetical protein
MLSGSFSKAIAGSSDQVDPGQPCETRPGYSGTSRRLGGKGYPECRTKKVLGTEEDKRGRLALPNAGNDARMRSDGSQLRPDLVNSRRLRLAGRFVASRVDESGLS